MPKVICTLPYASDDISGVKFALTTLEDGSTQVMLSEEIAEDVAARFISIPGYELFTAEVVEAETKADAEAEAKAATKAAEEAEAQAKAAAEVKAKADAKAAEETKAKPAAKSGKAAKAEADAEADDGEVF